MPLDLRHALRPCMPYFKAILLAIGLWIGGEQLWVASKAIFVARNDEPIWFWIWVLSGPVSVLPASILATFKPKDGGAWLVLGAIASLPTSFLAIAAHKSEEALPVASDIFVRYGLSMFALGIGSLIVW